MLRSGFEHSCGWEMTLTEDDGPASEMKADLETITSLAKRRGFVFPSAEIYGGFAAAYDYGPLGVEMKRQIRERWWRSMVQERDDVVGIEAAIITNPEVWRASGHVAEFTDPLVECLECQARLRADHVENNTCPNCGTVGKFAALHVLRQEADILRPRDERAHRPARRGAGRRRRPHHAHADARGVRRGAAGGR